MESPGEVIKIPTPPTQAAPIVSTPAQPVHYDPYDENYEDTTVPEDTPQTHEEATTVDVESSGDEEELAKRTEEEEHARAVAERNTDEFVNLSYGQALPIITKLLNDDAVMQRLKEVSLSLFGYSYPRTDA